LESKFERCKIFCFAVCRALVWEHRVGPSVLWDAVVHRSLSARRVDLLKVINAVSAVHSALAWPSNLWTHALNASTIVQLPRAVLES